MFTVEVEVCLLAGELRDRAFGLVNVRHGETSVDFIDGQRSVVTAATLCVSFGQRSRLESGVADSYHGRSLERHDGHAVASEPQIMC